MMRQSIGSARPLFASIVVVVALAIPMLVAHAAAVTNGSAAASSLLDRAPSRDGAPAASSASSTPQTLTQGVQKLAGDWQPYAGALASASVLAVALVEAFKAVFDLRTWFQEWSFLRWISPTASRGSVLTLQIRRAWLRTRRREALAIGGLEAEWLYLAIGSRNHRNVLCGQPLEKMMGQIQAAARVALDYPEQYAHVYGFLTAAVDLQHDLGDASSRSHAALQDPKVWQAGAVALRTRTLELGAADGSAEPPASGPDQAQSAQAKARLSNLVSRKLDGFQLRTDFWWTRWNQALAIATSMVVIFAALGTTGLADHVVERLLMGGVGGLLAPYAKDFSQALLGLVKR